MSLALRGIFTSNDDSGSNSNGKELWFENEHDKKTSFVFDESSSQSSVSNGASAETSQRVVIEKPCHLFLDCCIPNRKDGGTTAFLFGGLEIHSNSRNIEVYTLDEDVNANANANADNKSKSTKDSFEYLKTCRGTLITNDETIDSEKQQQNQQLLEPWEKELYRTIVIPPNSKPMPIKKLQLKLLSLRPAKCKMGYIKLVKFKGRLPDVDFVQQLPQSISSSQQQQQQQKQQLPISNNGIKSTQQQQNADMTNAISAITILIRNTQETMERSISSKFGEFQKLSFQQNRQIQNTMQSLERSIESVNDNLATLRQEVNSLTELQKSSNNTHREGEEETHSYQDDDDDTDNKEVEKEDDGGANIGNDNDDINDTPEKSDKEAFSIVELIGKMQLEHKREIKEMLQEEREKMLKEMDTKRDEFVKQVMEGLSKEKIDDAKSDNALANDDPIKDNGSCDVDIIECISLPDPSSLPIIQMDGTSIETETEISDCAQTITNNIS